MSQLQLAQKGFPAAVEKILKNDASGSVGLDIEITESLIMRDLEANIPELIAQVVEVIGVDGERRIVLKIGTLVAAVLVRAPQNSSP